MKCEVIKNEPLADGFFYISVAPETPMGAITPGQFVMIHCSHSADPFLRRPMSIADFAPDGSRFGMVIQKVGRGTAMLSQLVAHDTVDIVGPFGTGFTAPDGAKSIWIVAGGVGVAPFLGLVNIPGDIKYTVFLGARAADYIFYESYFKERGAETRVATDDGSLGHAGFVTTALAVELNSGAMPDAIFTCGPNVMMRAVANLAAERNVKCYVSLDNRMACGFGACLGCVTKRKSGSYVSVCRKGPVFDAETVEI